MIKYQDNPKTVDEVVWSYRSTVLSDSLHVVYLFLRCSLSFLPCIFSTKLFPIVWPSKDSLFFCAFQLMSLKCLAFLPRTSAYSAQVQSSLLILVDIIPGTVFATLLSIAHSSLPDELGTEPFSHHGTDWVYGVGHTFEYQVIWRIFSIWCWSHIWTPTSGVTKIK